MEEYNPIPQWLVTAVGVLLLVAGLYLLATPPNDTAMPRTAVLATLQPTPALEVPTPRPTVVVVYERASTTYVNVNQNVNVCIGLCR